MYIWSITAHVQMHMNTATGQKVLPASAYSIHEMGTCNDRKYYPSHVQCYLQSDSAVSIHKLSSDASNGMPMYLLKLVWSWCSRCYTLIPYIQRANVLPCFPNFCMNREWAQLHSTANFCSKVSEGNISSDWQQMLGLVLSLQLCNKKSNVLPVLNY
jgi:hypothetical protein